MGYRHHFYLVKKTDVEAIKNKTITELKDEFADEFGCMGMADIIPRKHIFELGKIYDDTDEQVYSVGVPLFSNDECMEYFEDYIPYIVGKDGILKTIEIYQNKVRKYLEDLQVDTYDEIMEETITKESKQKEALQDKIRYWKHDWLLNLDEDNHNTIVNSYLYEYEIFNLIFLLKTIDWENETILFYGS